MPITGEEIRANLTRFVARWSLREGYELSAQLIDRRQRICVEREFGLTTLYNQVDEGAWAEIADLHLQLDRAVAAAYGWSPNVAADPLEIKARLAERHAAIMAGADYEPFATAEPAQSRG